MHYTINYANIQDPAKKQKKAVADCRQFLGRSQFKKVCDGLVHDLRRGVKPELLANLLCLAGIQGYPATAFVNYAKERVRPEQLKLDLRQPVVLKARIMPPVSI